MLGRIGRRLSLDGLIECAGARERDAVAMSKVGMGAEMVFVRRVWGTFAR